MSAYLLAFVTPHNMDWFAEYQANVPQIVHKYGGKYLAIPKVVEVVEGTAPAPASVVLFTFPSMDAIHDFVNAPEYAPYKRARIEATESNLFAFEDDQHPNQR